LALVVGRNREGRGAGEGATNERAHPRPQPITRALRATSGTGKWLLSPRSPPSKPLPATCGTGGAPRHRAPKGVVGLHHCSKADTGTHSTTALMVMAEAHGLGMSQ